MYFFFFSSRRRHTRLQGDWSSDVCSSDLSRRVRAPPDRWQRRWLRRCAAPAPRSPTRHPHRSPAAADARRSSDPGWSADQTPRRPRNRPPSSARDPSATASPPAARRACESLPGARSEEHTSELQSPCNLVCRLLLEKKNHIARYRSPIGCIKVIKQTLLVAQADGSSSPGSKAARQGGLALLSLHYRNLIASGVDCHY